MDEIILVGAGGHTHACIDVIELTGQFKIMGFIEKNDIISQGNLGYSIIGIDDDLESIRKKYSYALITVGQIKSSNTRVELFQLLQNG